MIVLRAKLHSSTRHNSIKHSLFNFVNHHHNFLWVAGFSFSKLNVRIQKVGVGTVVMGQSSYIFTVSNSLWVWTGEDSWVVIV